MKKEDFNKMNLISTTDESIFNELVDKIINLKGAYNFDNTPIDIKVKSIILAINYPMGIINGIYLSPLNELSDLCKKKSLLRSI